MRRTNQGGSLAGFIIIGVLLTLILVGGLYGLNRYNAQRAADETAASKEAASEDEKKASPEAAKTETDSTDTSTQSRTEQSGTSNPQSQAPQPTPQPAATSAQLPQTGPADMLLAMVALGLLTFAGAHYARSRA